jgi:hypothetical protein
VYDDGCPAVTGLGLGWTWKDMMCLGRQRKATGVQGKTKVNGIRG